MNRFIASGTIARLAQQCAHPHNRSERGSWLYTGDNHRDPAAMVTAFFPDTLDLFAWLRDSEEWQCVGNVGGELTYRKLPGEHDAFNRDRFIGETANA